MRPIGVQKTKQAMLLGVGQDQANITVPGRDTVETVHIPLHHSTMADDGMLNDDFISHLAKADRVLGCLAGSIFQNLGLSFATPHYK